MRFLMVTTFFPPFNFGGDGAYVFRLSNELARRGHRVDVVHCADAFRVLQPAGPRASAPSDPGVVVHTLHSPLGPLSPLLTQQTGRALLKKGRIRRLIASRDFDVIHYHNMSLMGLDTLGLGDAIKLYTTHEHWLVCPMHVLWRNRREACTRRSCFTCQLVSRRPPQWWRYGSLPDRCLGQIDRFLCPSRFTLRKHEELGFGGHMVHLPYFLPRGQEPAETESPRDRPYVLFVGRLEKIKGLQDLLRVFRGYRGCDLVVVGEGGYERELKRLADGLSHVRFLGRLPYERIQHWYRHAIAVVVPSICYEVFGIVILEAFAVSTPALVTPFGALPEVIDESGGGVVYRSDQELVDGIETLRRDAALRAELGEKGREAFVRLWSEEPHIERYLGIIDEVARRSGRS